MDIKNKITEHPSRYDHLERMSVAELLQHINDEAERRLLEAGSVDAALKITTPEETSFHS